MRLFGSRLNGTIACAVLALLVFSEHVFAQAHVPPARRPVNVFVWDRFCRPYLFPSVAPAPVLSSLGVAPAVSTQYSAPTFIPTSPTYLLLGSASTTRPQLFFKDGTSYTVADYWRENDQLHFTTLEEGGTKSVPHNVPFDSLDEQRTKEAAKAQGFRFLIRDEPLDRWLQHRAQREKGRTGTGEKS